MIGDTISDTLVLFILSGSGTGTPKMSDLLLLFILNLLVCLYIDV